MMTCWQNSRGVGKQGGWEKGGRDVKGKSGQGWVAQLFEHCPVHQMVAGSIPSQDTSLGYGFDPWSGHICRSNQLILLSHTDVSLSLFLPSSLSKINKHILG